MELYERDFRNFDLYGNGIKTVGTVNKLALIEKKW